MSLLPSAVRSDPTLGRSIVRKSSSKSVSGIAHNDSVAANFTMKRGHSDPTPRRMQERPRGLRHFPPRHSGVLEWKPLVKKIEYKKPPRRVSSVKTITPPGSSKNWDEIPQGRTNHRLMSPHACRGPLVTHGTSRAHGVCHVQSGVAMG